MKSKTFIGVLLLVLATVIFVGTFYICLEPLQSHYLEVGRKPSVVFSTVFGFIFGGVVFTLFHVGQALTKDQAFGVEHTDFKFKDLVKSKAYIRWGIWGVITGGLLFFLWSNYNF